MITSTEVASAATSFQAYRLPVAIVFICLLPFSLVRGDNSLVDYLDKLA